MSNVTGLREVLANLDKEKRRIAEAVKTATRKKAEAIAATAAPLTPVQTGALLASQQIVETPDGAIVEYTAPYALEVHERTDVHHPNGEAKFLEKAVDQHTPGFAQAVGALAKEEL